MDKKPSWLKVRHSNSESYLNIKNMLEELSLSTVCQQAICPNIDECWNNGTATFMLLGDVCTRSCKFCAVKTGNPQENINLEEPFQVSAAIKKMRLQYVVLTSVDRDDLKDLGSGQFSQTVSVIKRDNPSLLVEVLTPDFNGVKKLIKKVISSSPDVFAHNVETVRRISPEARDRRSSYDQSLKTLSIVKEINPQQYTKSSVMLGLGETEQEIYQTLKDLKNAGCDIVTFGQYLAPTERHKKFLPIKEYITPQLFKDYRDMAIEMDFLYCASGPLVRSSYKAFEYFIESKINKQKIYEG